MRFTLISSPLEAFATSIFFDQLPVFSSIENLEYKEKCAYWKPVLSVRLSAYQ